MTSQAAPRVARLVAHIWTAAPHLRPETVRALIIHGARAPHRQRHHAFTSEMPRQFSTVLTLTARSALVTGRAEPGKSTVDDDRAQPRAKAKKPSWRPPADPFQQRQRRRCQRRVRGVDCATMADERFPMAPDDLRNTIARAVAPTVTPAALAWISTGRN